MTNKAIPDFASANSVSGDDYVLFYNDPSGIPAFQKITFTALFGNIPVAVNIANTLTASALVVSDKRTPANATITSVSGSIFYDDNYLYVTTANNVTKRVSLSVIT